MSTLKLLTKKEIEENHSKEIEKNSRRLTITNTALRQAELKLEEVNTKLSLAYEKTRAAHLLDEEKYLKKIGELQKEVTELEAKRTALLFPIEEEKNKAHNLFIEAEAVLTDAKTARRDVDNKRLQNERESEFLKDRLDEVSDKELLLNEREKKLLIEEDNLRIQKELLTNLSNELLNKLHGIRT